MLAHGSLMSFMEMPYQHAMFQGEVWKYIDIADIHSYRFPSGYRAEMDVRRKVMQMAGAEGFPLWMTENGCWMDGLGATNTIWRGNVKQVQSEAQEMLSAEHYAKSQVILQMLGVSRNYYFIFASYFESKGRKDWGMIRPDGTVKPVCAAAAAMTFVLADAVMEGEYAAPAGFAAYLFRHADGTQTLCFWKKSEADRKESILYDGDRPGILELSVPDGEYRFTAPFGQERRVSAAGGVLRLAASRHPAYVSGFSRLLPSRAADPRGTRKRYVPPQDEDLSVVVRLELDKHDYTLGAMKTLAEVNAKTCRAKVHVWNLSDEPKTGRLDVVGARLDGLPADWSLPPMGEAVAEAVLVPVGGNYTTDLEIGGRFNGRRITTSRAKVFFRGHFLEESQRRPLASASDPRCWQNNSSATACVIERDEAEGAVRLNFRYENVVDRWAFPRLILASGESLARAKIVEFEIKSAQNKVENDFQLVSSIFEAPSVAADWVSFLAPVSTWETRRLPLASVKSPGKVRSICLGGLPRGTDLTLWIRNVRILE